MTTSTTEYTLTDHSLPPSDRKPLGVKVTSNGTDFLWIEADGYGYPESGAQIGVEFWNGRLRLLAYTRGDGDPTVIDLECLRAVNLGATVGRQQGWDVFDCGGGNWSVQADDDHAPRLSDDEAIRLARAAGVQCDEDGNVTPPAVA